MIHSTNIKLYIYVIVTKILKLRAVTRSLRLNRLEPRIARKAAGLVPCLSPVVSDGYRIGGQRMS